MSEWSNPPMERRPERVVETERYRAEGRPTLSREG
jgi:hypothetical protein